MIVFIPDWFRPTDELLAHYNIRTNDRGDSLQTAAFLRDEPFEVLLLRSEQMVRRARGSALASLPRPTSARPYIFANQLSLRAR